MGAQWKAKGREAAASAKGRFFEVHSRRPAPPQREREGKR